MLRFFLNEQQENKTINSKHYLYKWEIVITLLTTLVMLEEYGRTKFEMRLKKNVFLKSFLWECDMIQLLLKL
jgi:hypothetical protein